MNRGAPCSLRHADGTIFVTMPAPAAAWSTNQERREHWSKYGPRRRAWRDATAAAFAGLGIGPLAGRWEITLRLPVKANRRRDPHNWFPAVKAAVDGMVDAGLWPDDTPEHVTVREPEFDVENDLVAIRLFPIGEPQPWD